MKLDRCCALIDKRLRTELAGNLRAGCKPDRDRLSSLCAGVSVLCGGSVRFLSCLLLLVW